MGLWEDGKECNRVEKHCVGETGPNHKNTRKKTKTHSENTFQTYKVGYQSMNRENHTAQPGGISDTGARGKLGCNFTAGSDIPSVSEKRKEEW